MLLIQLCGGLALITFGVRFLRKGFDRLFGGKVVIWLEKAAKSPIRALLAGVVTGAVAPSSTGLSVLVTHILGNGTIRTDRMLAILLGANIGLTLLANIVAFSVGSYAGLLLFAGVIGFQFCKGEKVRGAGQCLLAFGFIFLAMQFLGEASVGFGKEPDVAALFAILERHPYLLCLAAAILGVLLQSSTATVGLGIGLAQGGVLPLSLFIVWIVGTNLGLGVTSLIVSWPNLEGRRLGFANLMAKGIVALPLMVVGPSLGIYRADAAMPLSNQLALTHTAFNVIAGLVALPILKPLLALAKRWFVPDPVEATRGFHRETFLDPAALTVPSIALVQATREALHMTDQVKGMLAHLWTGRERRDYRMVQEVAGQDDNIDSLNQRLTVYLSQINRDGEDFDSRWHLTLLSLSGELEVVGDILEKSLSATVLKQLKGGMVFGDEEEEELTMLHQKTMHQFNRLEGLITSRNPVIANQLIAAKEEISTWVLFRRRTHYEGLRSDATAVDSTLCFLDMIDCFRRINKHLATVAYGFASSDLDPASDYRELMIRS